MSIIFSHSVCQWAWIHYEDKETTCELDAVVNQINEYILQKKAGACRTRWVLLQVKKKCLKTGLKTCDISGDDT